MHNGHVPKMPFFLDLSRAHYGICDLEYTTLFTNLEPRVCWAIETAHMRERHLVLLQHACLGWLFVLSSSLFLCLKLLMLILNHILLWVSRIEQSLGKVWFGNTDNRLRVYVYHFCQDDHKGEIEFYLESFVLGMSQMLSQKTKVAIASDSL